MRAITMFHLRLHKAKGGQCKHELILKKVKKLFRIVKANSDFVILSHKNPPAIPSHPFGAVRGSNGWSISIGTLLPFQIFVVFVFLSFVAIQVP